MTNRDESMVGENVEVEDGSWYEEIEVGSSSPPTVKILSSEERYSIYHKMPIPKENAIAASVGITEKAFIKEQTDSAGLSNPRAAESSSYRRLKVNTLRNMYSFSSYVRAMVDGIARTISSLNWTLIGDGSEANKNNIRKLLDTPNMNKQTFKQTLFMFISDMLIVDAGAIEKMRSATGDLVGFSIVDGATIRIKADEKGNVQSYAQYIDDKQIGNDFSKRNMVYRMMFPRSYSIYGYPILESIVVEIIALLNHVNTTSDSFEKNEIPPGILMFEEIGNTAYERFKKGIENKDSTNKLKVLKGVKNGKFVPLKNSNQELQAADLVTRIERIVFRNFGLSPTEMGSGTDINRATAEVQMKIGQSRLIKPLVELLEETINDEIISEMPGASKIRFKFILPSIEDPEARSRTMKNYFGMGALSPNEIRKIIVTDFETTDDLFVDIPNGDKHYIILGNRIFCVEDQKFVEETPTANQVSGRTNPNKPQGQGGKRFRDNGGK